MSLRKLALAWSIVLVSVAGVGTSISIVAGGDSDEPGTIVQDAPSSQTKTSLIEQIALEHEALHGTWELVEIQVDGVPEKRSSWDDGTRSWTKIRFADGVATNLGEGGGTKEYICYPNPTTQPKQINEFSDTYLLQGIYKIEGTTLTIAYHRIKEIRPTSFDHTKSAGRPSPLQTLIYKRIKDEPPAPSPNAAPRKKCYDSDRGEEGDHGHKEPSRYKSCTATSHRNHSETDLFRNRDRVKESRPVDDRARTHQSRS